MHHEVRDFVTKSVAGELVFRIAFDEEAALEHLIKGINACSFNNKFWIYLAAATNLGYRVTVTDTHSGGEPKVYTNPVGTVPQTTTDTSAFNCP